MRSGSFSALSAISLIPIAFHPGGPHLRDSATTLYPRDSYTLSAPFMTFSNAKTSISHSASRSFFFRNCMTNDALFPEIAILT